VPDKLRQNLDLVWTERTPRPDFCEESLATVLTGNIVSKTFQPHLKAASAVHASKHDMRLETVATMDAGYAPPQEFQLQLMAPLAFRASQLDSAEHNEAHRIFRMQQP
jgi:hypothetical protein